MALAPDPAPEHQAPGVGHMGQLERRPEVSAILLGLLERAVPARSTA